MELICKKFPISEEEYYLLNDKYGKLVEHEAWDLMRKNSKNNHTDEQIDIAQELRIALLRAGSYYKRQTYIEKCLSLCEKHVKDEFLRLVIDELKWLWSNKTRHGANKQKFGPHQEKILELIVENYVPKNYLPDRLAKLKLDAKFSRYCKSITWNRQRALGKHITREKSIRTSLVSLSEYDYLGGN